MIRLFKHYIPHAVLLLGLVDFVLLFLAADIAWQLRASQIHTAIGGGWARVWPCLGFAITLQTAMVSVGVYGAEALRSMRQAAARLLVAVALGIIGLALLNFLTGAQAFWRSTLAYSMALAIAFTMVNRLFAGRILGAEAFRRKVLVLGAGDRAHRLRALAERPGSGFEIVGFVAMTDAPAVVTGAIRRGNVENLPSHVTALGATEVVLALEERRNALPLADLLRIKTTGVHVNEFASFMERETGRVDLDTVNPSWLIFSDGFSSGRAVSSVLKRLFDIAASSLLLVLSAPLILLFALTANWHRRATAFLLAAQLIAIVIACLPVWLAGY